MKKVVSIILGIIIFAIPVFCFAWTTEPNPVILPVGNDEITNTAYGVLYNDDLNRYFWSNDPTTYIIFYNSSESAGQAYYLVFSENPNAVLYNSKQDTSVINSYSLNNFYDGYYYYRSGQTLKNYDNVYLSSSINPTSVIDDVQNTVFSVSFSLSSIIEGATSWLSAVVDGVLQAPLLLFLILSSFIGIAVGLLFRFRRG